jgi:hypothetical protein
MGPLVTRLDRGRPTLDWLAGPCHTAPYKGGGGHWLEVRGSPPATTPHLHSLADLQGSAGVTGSAAAAATPSTVAALAQIGLRVAAFAQISYMASGSGSAPAGDGIPLFPSLSLCCSCIHTRTHTVKVRTRLDPHLVDPNSITYDLAR